MKILVRGVLVTASVIATMSVASGASAQATTYEPLSPLGKCVGYYRIMGILTGEVKSPKALKQYPWPRQVNDIRKSKQNWSYREALAARAFLGSDPNPERARTSLDAQSGATDTLVNLIGIDTLMFPGAPSPKITTVMGAAEKCDAMLGLRGN